MFRSPESVVRYHPLYEGIWTEEKLEGCPPEERLFAIYLFSNPRVRPSGIYRVMDDQAAADLGIPVKRVIAYFADLAARHFIVRDHAWVWVVGYYHLQPKQPFLVRGVHADIDFCTSRIILEAFSEKYPLLKQPLTNRLATISQRSPNGTTRAYAEQMQSRCRNPIGRVAPESDPSTALSGFHPDHAAERAHALEVLRFLNDKAGRSYRATDATLNLIKARLRSGATVANCRGVIARKVREWSPDPKMAKYLRPETLFNATKFESYLGERPPDA